MDLHRNESSVLRVARREVDGREVVDVRVWARPPKGKAGPLVPVGIPIACTPEVWRRVAEIANGSAHPEG